MKKFLKRTAIFILVLLVIGGSVIFIFRKQLLAQYIPTVKPLGNIEIKIKNDTSFISSKLLVENNSFLKIEIDSIKYKIELFGKTYLESKKFLGIVLRGYGKDSINFSLSVPYERILKDLQAQRKDGNSASYSVAVSLQYSTVFGRSEFPINKSAKIKIPQPPELDIVKIDYKKVRWKSIQADALIKITNYNVVSMSIKELNYSMVVSKQGNLKGKYNEAIVIKPNGTTFVKLPIEITADNMGKTIYKIIRDQDNCSYTLKLNAILESEDPFKESFHVDIVKDGRMELRK